MQSRRKKCAAIGAAAAFTLVLAACNGNGEDENGQEGSGSGLYVTLSGDGPFTENYNPFIPSSTDGTQVFFETLFFANSHREGDAEHQPVLGVEYELSEDNLTLVVQTRENVTWSDGEPFTAEDVAFTFNYVRDHPAINSAGLNGEALATGEHEVTITYPEAATVSVLNSLATQVIIPEHIWADVEDPATETVMEPVGTGPFIPGEFDAQTYTYVANPDYWDEGKPAIAGVRFIATADNEASADNILDGNITWSNVSVPNPEEFFDPNPDVTVFGEISGLLSLAACSNEELGCEGPQTDPAVRQAIYHAMDRDQINELAFTGDALPISPTYVYVPRDEIWVSDGIEEPMAPQEGNEERAAQILEDAGYERGSDGIYARDGESLRIEVTSVSGWNDWNLAVDTMAEQLRPMGIDLVPNLISQNAWSSDVNQGNYQLLVWNVQSGTPNEPFGLYRAHFASSATGEVGGGIPGQGYARYSNDTVDEALSVLTNAVEEDERAEQYAIIQEEIVEDLPYIPIVSFQQFTQFNTSEIENWPTPDNAYAAAFSWMNPDFGVVLKNVTPAG